MKTNKGFSLVELIVVIAIMAVIAAVAIPVYSNYVTKAEDAVELQKVYDLIYAVKLANVEFSTETTAELDADRVTVTVDFYGNKSEKSAKHVSDVMTLDYTSGSDVTLTLSKKLGDDAVSEVNEALDEINTYNMDSGSTSTVVHNDTPVPIVTAPVVNTELPSKVIPAFDELLEDISVYITSETYDDYCAEVYIFADGTKYATLTVTVYDKTTWMENSELVNNICEYIKSKYETVDSENKINVSTSDVCYFDDILSNI
jgi:type IV pilus assembly protein PilA